MALRRGERQRTSIFRDVCALPTAVQAGHVGLLTLRAAVRAKPRSPYAFMFTGGSQARDGDHVAHTLASFPKPLALTGERRGEQIRIRIAPAAESREDFVRLQLQIRKRSTDYGQQLRGLLLKRYGGVVDELPVTCVGAGVTIVTYARVAVHAFQDYIIAHPHSCALSIPGAIQEGGVGVSSHQAGGAVVLLRFNSAWRFLHLRGPWSRRVKVP